MIESLITLPVAAAAVVFAPFGFLQLYGREEFKRNTYQKLTTALPGSQLADSCGRFLDQIFGPRHLTARCLLWSCIFSSVAIGLFTFVVLSVGPDIPTYKSSLLQLMDTELAKISTDATQTKEEQQVIDMLQEYVDGKRSLIKANAALWILIFMLLVNLSSDYLSLFETRIIINALAHTKPLFGRIILLGLDLLFSTLIVVTVFAVVAYLMRNNWGLVVEPEFMRAVDGLIDKLSNIPADQRDTGFLAVLNSLQVQIWIVQIAIGVAAFVVSILSTYWTSMFLWVYVIGLVISRFLLGIDRTRNFFGRLVNVETYPIAALGGVCALVTWLGSFVAIGIYYLR